MTERLQRITSTSQIRNAEHVGRLLGDPYADPNEMRSSLDALDEDGLRPFNYDYYYLNLLSLFGDVLSVDKVRRMAMACNTFRLWQSWESFAEAAPSSLQFQTHGSQAAVRLRGWDVAQLRTLLAAGRGLIVCTSHYGAFRYILSDLMFLGFPVTMGLDTDSVDAFRHRFQRLRSNPDIAPFMTSDLSIKIDGAGSGRVVDVEKDKLATIALVKALRNNQIVHLFTDGNVGWEGHWGATNKSAFDFLGFPISMKSGVTHLAAMSGAPILPVFVTRTAPLDVRYRNMDVIGEVSPADPIFPGGILKGSRRKEFIDKTTEHIFQLYASAILRDSNQWEMACLFHRWRAPQPDGSPVIQTSQCPEKRLETGRVFRLNSARVARVPTDGKLLLVDAKTLQVLALEQHSAQVVEALLTSEGINQSWWRSVPDAERSRVINLLADLERRSLLSVN
jgi:hypothetical protein